jgi:hypothetical protein
VEVFVAANAKAVIDGFDRARRQELRLRVNESVVDQADRYVFMADDEDLPLVKTRLPRR